MGANNLTTTTYYIGAGQEVQNGVPVRYYSLGGNTLGVRQGASVSWLYGDHLGSTSASSGAASTSERYYAYGKDRGTGSLPTDHRFTGQISDASGLVFMNARYYDPVLGSFLSPDTVVPEPGQPEGYNRYAYANGNPLLFSDPSGHQANCAEKDEWCWNNRWYLAHGYGFDAATGSWSDDSINPTFAAGDIGMVTDLLKEAGIFLNDSVESWTFARGEAIAQGVATFGRWLRGGFTGWTSNGLSHLGALIGGGVDMYLHAGGSPPGCHGGAACALPNGRNAQGNYSVQWGSDFIDGQNATFVAATAVHELAHVIDWASWEGAMAGGVNAYQASMATLSAGWSVNRPLTSYAACIDCINSWEKWAEAVTYSVYGMSYINASNGEFQALSNNMAEVQSAQIRIMLGGLP
jgi:RHS repeat-associated protein